MSWKACQMSQRAEFVSLVSESGQEFTEACSRFGISRKTGYKWLARFLEEGEAGLLDRSRRPHQIAGKSSLKVEKAVIALRKKRPTWGGRKLRTHLLSSGHLEVPSASTITSILNRYGLLSVEDGAGSRRSYQRFEHPNPNDLWQMDFKGHFALGGGGRCHPLTVLDDHSRYSIGVRACGNEQGITVMTELASLFRQYGLPVRMLMDNGSPWGDEGGQPWTIVTSWLIRLGIRISHIRPHHPQTQGKIERFHRTFKADILRNPRLQTLSSCQRKFDPWREIYNRERPHEALKMAVPASRYRVSERSYPSVLPEIEYGNEMIVRRVRTDYLISFQGYRIRIGKAFEGQPVGIRESSNDGVYEVFYCQQRIGWADVRDVNHDCGKNLSLIRSFED